MNPEGSPEDKRQLTRRREILKHIQDTLHRYRREPPYPHGMEHVIEELRRLDDHVQDDGQRDSRERLIIACEAYTRKNNRGDEDTSCMGDVRSTMGTRRNRRVDPSQRHAGLNLGLVHVERAVAQVTALVGFSTNPLRGC
jgi:hypothetical protein